MKKLIAALLVLTMVVALSSTAMAACNPFKDWIGGRVTFKKNTVAYNQDDKSKSGTIVSKNSIGMVKDICGTKWVAVYLNPNDYSKWGWFKVGDLRKTKANEKVEVKVGTMRWYYDWIVRYSVGGKNGSTSGNYIYKDAGAWADEPGAGYRISEDCYKHVKATSKVWVRSLPGLTGSNRGYALRPSDGKVKYMRWWGLDDRFVAFYKIRYKGKCSFVSSLYTKLVK